MGTMQEHQRWARQTENIGRYVQRLFEQTKCTSYISRIRRINAGLAVLPVFVRDDGQDQVVPGRLLLGAYFLELESMIRLLDLIRIEKGVTCKYYPALVLLRRLVGKAHTEALVVADAHLAAAAVAA